MRLADLKNDFVFRKIFGQHPELTTALLNDVLGLDGDRHITELMVVPPEQAPSVAGAKLSILDVKCRDQRGRWFVVEMQVLHVAGFVQRVVYNACKTYTDQLRQGQAYAALSDVIALSVCDFVLWPDDERVPAGLAPVPAISSWAMREQQSGAAGLTQVQYTFVELPKVPLAGPLATTAAQWAWMFRAGDREDSIPPQMSEAQRRVLELCNEATFTQGERDAYRRVVDEIDQARQLALDGEARGEARGKAEGLRAAIEALCEVLGIALDEERHRQVAALDAPQLTPLLEQIKQTRTWPLA